GVLRQDETPAYYVYHQRFTHDGETFNRRGFMGRVRLKPFGEGNIYPHEETHSKAKADRLKLTKATQQNNSQIFGLYPDSENEIITLLDAACTGPAPVEATDHLGVTHLLWPVDAPDLCAKVSALMDERPMFVADGHHRYETACNYKQHLVDTNGPLQDDHPANFVMTMLVGMSDPGMIVLPTHRLLRGTPTFSSDEIISKLSDAFQCEVLPKGLASAVQAWDRMESADQQGLIALYAAQDDTWVLARAQDQAAEKMKALAPNQSEDWRLLGVSILHRLVIDDLLGCAGHSKPTYVHEVSEVVEGFQGKGSQAESDSDEPYTLAALVMPAKLSDVEQISLHKERMPAKSTYFFPKLLSGLTFNPLR
ncbi:MAG: DUF1015 domain-containing protein, partial [Planctomycetota bacterium]